MRKVFKYRLKASRQTLKNAEEWLHLCRELYNSCLEERKNAYENKKKNISVFAQMTKLPILKKERPEYRKLNAQTLQDVVQRLNRTYQAFFRRMQSGEKPGFPRFKGKDRYHSFTLKQAGYKLEGKYLHISNIGKFKMFLSRPIEGDIKTVTLKKNFLDKWDISFSCENVPSKPLPKTGKSIGIDVGCQYFVITSDGEHIENPRFLQTMQKTLAKKQRNLSHKRKKSHRRQRAKMLLVRIYEKTFNQRRDFHFKVARKLLQANDIIHIEDMNSFKSHRSLNRSMRDVAWFGFFDILTFKAEEAGKQVIGVPAKNTSQICSCCEKMVEKNLSTRIHECSFCGLVLDRDVNAARNILRLGQSLQGAKTLVSAMN